jgi:hypothetical protein
MKLLPSIFAQVTNMSAGGLTVAGHTITTKTLAGWALGIVIIVLAVNCVGTIQAAKKEHESGERNEKVKFAIITLVAGIGVVAVLDAIGLISFTDISTGFSAI